MTRAPREPRSAAHFDKPSDVASHIAREAAVIVTGKDVGHAATLAVSVARAAAGTRRVALGDLAGDLAPVYALSGGEDAVGLAECFRDGLSLNDIARPVSDHPNLFVLPAGHGVRTEPSLASAERWTRLIRGFAEAGGLLILVVPESSPVIGVLTAAGAVTLYAGRAAEAPAGVHVAATIGAAVHAVATPSRPGAVRAWHVAAASLLAAAVCGWGAIALIHAANAPDGVVVVAPALRLETERPVGAPGVGAAPGPSRTAPDTVSITERTPENDRARIAPFVVEVVAANTASNANSLLRDATDGRVLPVPTIAVVSVPAGRGQVSRWHKVMFGAWRSEAEALVALEALRKQDVVAVDGGAIVRAPYAVLLVDSASVERARAVMDVWRAKGVTPYALAQDDGTMRVYAGAFETVAQAVTMAAMIRAAGGPSVVAYRTGRP